MAMDTHLQQRIVGAIVLVTLGVIFIPALLDGSGYQSRQIQNIEISDKPEFPPLSQKVVEPVPTPVQISREAARQGNSKAGDEPASVSGADKPVHAFALQVGTFENESNAGKLRDKLNKAGYTTYIQSADNDGKPSYKVRIGPNLQRSQLESVNDEVKKKFKLDGYIVNHP